MHYCTGTSVDGSVGEGISDVVSMRQIATTSWRPTSTPTAPASATWGPRRYPDDVISQVHTDGLGHSGSMWDAESREETMSEEEAKALLSRVVVDGAAANLIADTYDAMVFGDDDDGDTNGTPNICDIIEAFGMHGLGPEAWAMVCCPWARSHHQSGRAQRIPGVCRPRGRCTGLLCGRYAQAKVVWSIDGGATWTETALDFDGISHG